MKGTDLTKPKRRKRAERPKAQNRPSLSLRFAIFKIYFYIRLIPYHYYTSTRIRSIHIDEYIVIMLERTLEGYVYLPWV
jgi:hypothetical protein